MWIRKSARGFAEPDLPIWQAEILVGRRGILAKRVAMKGHGTMWTFVTLMMLMWMVRWSVWQYRYCLL